MVIAGYPLPHDKLGLVVIAPLKPTPEVVEWLQQTGNVNFVVAPNKVCVCVCERVGGGGRTEWARQGW
jgi:hypothetical protein